MCLKRLLDEHLKLRALGANLVALVSSDRPCDPDELAAQRWDLARMVHQHLVYEERQLLRHLDDDPRPEARVAGALARTGVERLHECYKAHVVKWTPSEIEARWPVFQASVKSLVIRMKAALDREEADVFAFIPPGDTAGPQWQPNTRNWAGDAIALQHLIQRKTQPDRDMAPSNGDHAHERRPA